MSADRVFVDTNVFLYAFDSRDRNKCDAANAWLKGLWRSRTGRLSWQVLHEFHANATKRIGVPESEARNAVRLLTDWRPAESTTKIIDGAWRMMDDAHVSYWDALILAAAEQLECAWLLSEDFQHERRYGSITVLNPFQTNPEEVIGATRQ